jgi:hypothetical protein
LQLVDYAEQVFTKRCHVADGEEAKTSRRETGSGLCCVASNESQTCLSDRTGTMLAREYAARGGSSRGSRAHYPVRLVVVALVDIILGVFQVLED